MAQEQHIICNKEADIATIKGEVSSIKEATVRIETKLDDQYKHMYVGNGSPSFASTLNSHEQFILAAKWAICALITAVLPMIFVMVKMYMKGEI